MFYKTCLVHHSLLAKIQVFYRAFYHILQACRLRFQSIFKKISRILHHLAFLVWLSAHYFLRPITRFQPLKTHFLTIILPFSAMCFMVLEGFVYTNAVDIYAFCLAFCGTLPCVQHQNAVHLAPKCTAFSIKTHCVQHQNALHLAANRTEFSTKTPQNWCKWWPSEINIHFAACTN